MGIRTCCVTTEPGHMYRGAVRRVQLRHEAIPPDSIRWQKRQQGVNNTGAILMVLFAISKTRRRHQSYGKAWRFRHGVTR